MQASVEAGLPYMIDAASREQSSLFYLAPIHHTMNALLTQHTLSHRIRPFKRSRRRHCPHICDVTSIAGLGVASARDFAISKRLLGDILVRVSAVGDRGKTASHQWLPGQVSACARAISQRRRLPLWSTGGCSAPRKRLSTAHRPSGLRVICALQSPAHARS